jgi:hypothetical protein
MPSRLFSYRTSVTCLVLAFISNSLLEWIVYILPIYSQSLKQATPLGSGVDVLPFSVFYVPLAVLTGCLMSKFGRYKPIHWVGFGFTSLACGLLATLTDTSSRAAWVCFQLLCPLVRASL